MFDELEAEFMKNFEQRGDWSSEAIENFAVFIQEGRFLNEKNAPFTYDFAFWLHPIYDIKRVDIASGKYKEGIILFKAAQMGATTWAMLFALWLVLGGDGRGHKLQVGFFFPQQEHLRSLVATRFDPLLKANPKAQSLQLGVDNTGVKQFVNGTIYFLYMQGKVSTDAVPLDVIILDETRKMEVKDIESAEYRNAQSDAPMKVWMSTAYYPGSHHERKYASSTMHEWHSRCPSCACGGKVLALEEPTAFCRRVDEDSEGDWEYFCQETGEVMEPKNGEYRAAHPKRRLLGLRFPAVLSPRMSATDLMRKYLGASNKPQFFMDTMARPAISASGAQVTMPHIDYARQLGQSMGYEWTKQPYPLDATYMGVDCRTEELHVVVGTKNRLLHVEVLQGPETFQRLRELILQMRVKQCLIDYGPLTNETSQLAREMGNVYLALYKGGEMLRVNKTKDEFQVAEEIRTTRMLLIDKTKSLKYSLAEFANGRIAMPPDAIEQFNFLDQSKKLRPSFNISEEFASHMTSILLISKPKSIKDDVGQRLNSSNEIVEEFVDSGGVQSHFAHALNYYRMMCYYNEGAGEVIFAQGRHTAQPVVREVVQHTCGQCRWARHRVWNSDLEEGYGRCAKLGTSIHVDTPICKVKGLFRARPTA
jgi:hypothetical protein